MCVHAALVVGSQVIVNKEDSPLHGRHATVVAVRGNGKLEVEVVLADVDVDQLNARDGLLFFQVEVGAECNHNVCGDCTITDINTKGV